MKKLPETVVERDVLEKVLRELPENIVIVASKSIKSEQLLLISEQGRLINYKVGEPKSVDLLDYKTVIHRYKPEQIVAVGGGTAIDIAKLLTLKFSSENDLKLILSNAVPLEKDVDTLIAIPTTCGTGTEVTSIAIVENLEGDLKVGIVDDCLIPTKVYLDSTLLKSLPSKPFLYSALDAMTHAIESYISPKSNSMSREISLYALRLLCDNFGEAYRGDETALEKMLLGSYFAGYAFNTAGVGLIHAMAYPLGAELHFQHGLANGILLPFVLQFYKNTVNNESLNEIFEILSDLHKSQTLKEFLRELGLFSGYSSELLNAFNCELFSKNALRVERLIANSPCTVNESDLLHIYHELLLTLTAGA